MIALPLSVLLPYLTYILTGNGRNGIQRPELNQELINSLHIYAGVYNFILVSVMLHALDATPLASLSHQQTINRTEVVLFFH